MKHAAMMKAIAALMTIAVVTAACGGGGNSENSGSDRPTALESAKETCADLLQETLEAGDMDDEATAADFLVLGDDGATVTVTQPIEGEIATKLSVVAGTCLLVETDAPDSVKGTVSQVTALMGRQQAKWGDIDMSYSYHPKNGFFAVLTTAKQR